MQEQTPASSTQRRAADSGAVLARVEAMRLEASDVLSLELRALNGHVLPPAEAGSHVDLFLPNGLTRSYSVMASHDGIYIVAIKREAASLGGSAYVHDRLRVGDEIGVAPPRNLFALAADAPYSLLIAGGIGITPLLAMARSLEREGRAWRLHYAVRNAAAAPFARTLGEFGDAVQIHGSAESGRLDLAALVADAPPDTHFYCCGPPGMLDAFTEATKDVDPARVHVERFGAAPLPADAGSFEVRLARSGRQLTVGPETTVLDALLDAGVDVDYSCRQGICGSCEVRVLDGSPDHRDEILTEAERTSGKTMMVCCSRAKSASLTLDL